MAVIYKNKCSNNWHIFCARVNRIQNVLLSEIPLNWHRDQVTSSSACSLSSALMRDLTSLCNLCSWYIFIICFSTSALLCSRLRVRKFCKIVYFCSSYKGEYRWVIPTYLFCSSRKFFISLLYRCLLSRAWRSAFSPFARDFRSLIIIRAQKRI